MATTHFELTRIVHRLEADLPVEREGLVRLLGLSDPTDTARLFDAARRVRGRYFGSAVFFYGFLYFSTHCRNNCRFCLYRRANTVLARYRKTREEILSAAREMADTGVHLIDLTMGEDPAFHCRGEAGYRSLIDMVTSVRSATRLPIMVSPGVVPDAVLAELADAGITWYACYQETHNRRLYRTLRRGQGFDDRLSRKHRARQLGMLIEEGILTGVGERPEDLADSLRFMKEMGVDQARVMTFVPQPGTPMAAIRRQDSTMELKIVAVMRLLLHDALIPASLDVDGLGGLKARLDAGANVVTSIVPPRKGLAGVANSCLDIEASRRTLDRIVPVLESSRLSPASAQAYAAWITSRQAILRAFSAGMEKQAC